MDRAAHSGSARDARNTGDRTVTRAALSLHGTAGMFARVFLGVMVACMAVSAHALGDGTPAPDSCEFQPSPPIAQGVAVPANIPAIPAMKRFIQGGIGELSVKSATSGSFRTEQDPRSDLYFLIRPEQPLVPGQSTTLDLAVTCNGSAIQPAPLTVKAVAAAPLPTTLGTVNVDADRRRARVALSPEMIPFVSTLAVTSVLEGRGDAATKPLVHYA